MLTRQERADAKRARRVMRNRRHPGAFSGPTQLDEGLVAGVIKQARAWWQRKSSGQHAKTQRNELRVAEAQKRRDKTREVAQSQQQAREQARIARQLACQARKERRATRARSG